MQLEYEIEITEDFINYRNEYKNKFRSEGRDENWRLMHADCLLLEWHLISSGKGKNPNTMRYDVVIPEYNRCEIKSVNNGGSVTIGSYTRQSEFDHYIFYRFNQPRTRPMEIGDIVSLKIVQIDTKDSIESQCRLSQFNESSKSPKYYVWAQDGKFVEPDSNFSVYKQQESVYSKPLFA